MQKVSVVMWQHNIWCVRVERYAEVQHTTPHTMHVHTPNVMLLHNHTDFLHF